MNTYSDFLGLHREVEADAKRRLVVSPINSWADLEDIRVALAGRESGRLNELMRLLPELPAADRGAAGALANQLKHEIESWLKQASEALRARETKTAHAIDLTMPARRTWKGSIHPVTQVIDEIVEIFREIGFAVALGPEVETEWYNFAALNFPADHPAMDMHDTLYLGPNVLLRTHTSPVQIRTLQRYPPPIRILAPGNVYRRDAFDASHAPMFAQIEGLAVDEGVAFVDLKATLSHFARRFFGPTATRFRPSFFPFTEPSAEMDVECRICQGAGCGTCKQTGWTEILGCGMVHPYGARVGRSRLRAIHRMGIWNGTRTHSPTALRHSGYPRPV